jgi:nitronate monooxygenase
MSDLKSDWTFPIFQAPIGGIASPELAAAVSNAGAVGHLACTWRTSAQLDILFRKMLALTDRPYGANFVLDFPIEEQLDAALSHGVRFISFFWGDGTRYVARVKTADAVAIQVVGSIGEARRAADAGFDLIVAQGREAGGHVRGQLGTMTLVPQIVDVVGAIPVLAGGGIIDRRGVAAAFALGAAGVWVGTRFLAACEADIHPSYQTLVLDSDGDDTVYSALFDVGWPNASLRTLKNATTHYWELAGRPAAPNRPGEGDQVAQRADGSKIVRYSFSSPTRDTSGAVEEMALYAGEGVGLVRSREPAAAIVADLAGGLGPLTSPRGRILRTDQSTLRR